MPLVKHSVCALDCPDACSVLVTVEDGRATRLRGNPDHPVTRGFLCAKVARYLEREYSPERLLHPLRRTGKKGEGQFARISWDEALDQIATRLRAAGEEFGPEAVLPYSYAGTMGYLNGQGMDRRFFHRFGASRLDRTICSAAGVAGQTLAMGVRYSTPPEQFRDAKLILAWGANILGTNVHLWPFIVEARRNGARFYTIDPRLNRTGRLSDKHFFVNPGSDAALAFGLMHVIFAEGLEDADYIARHTDGIDELRARVASYTPEATERLTGIPRHEIAALAREYATTRPAAIRLNYGIQRSERGGLAAAAVSLLPVITGQWRYAGGGMQLSTSQAFRLNVPQLAREDLQLRSPLGRPARVVNMSQLAEALLDLEHPPVKALVVYNSNPAAIAPDQNRVLQGLAREDLFTVVLEQFLTDTARHADIVLPATTFLEHTDLYFAYGHYYLQLARPVVPAPGEARPNVEVFRQLARRMGFDDPCFADTEDDMIRTLLASEHPFVRGITLEQLEREHSVRLRVGEPFLPFAEGGFEASGGRANLRLPDYEPPVESRLGDAALRTRFPLEMISPKNDDSMNSTFGNRPDTDMQTAVLEMHAADAAPRGIADGDLVRAFNQRGATVFTAKVNGSLQPGVVAAPAVRWPSRSQHGRSANALVAPRLTDMGGGPVFYSCLVQVEKCGD
ncbi:MAG: molybdopterin-dependent oxidoreductase [Bryobacterales bacterium]|nr:molybdopterin-dependent oxidoreductase [Bryobacterales bacterium]